MRGRMGAFSGSIRNRGLGLLAAGLAVFPCLCLAEGYHSPLDMAYAPNGAMMAVGDYTAKQVLVLKADGAIQKTIPLTGQPAGIAWAGDGARFYVAERGAGTVAEVDPVQGTVTKRFSVGRYPLGLAVGGGRLVVCNNGMDTVSVIDLKTGAETAKVPCVYRPWEVALTPDGATAVVGNLLPLGDARRSDLGCAISLIDVAGGKKIADVSLPSGSINLHGIAVSSDGKWAYAVHSIGRYTLPTTQLERGWMMTHALSLIDLTTQTYYATVLLDSMSEGAADPWKIAVSKDGATAWISLAGAQQIARVDIGGIHLLLQGKNPKTGSSIAPPAGKGRTPSETVTPSTSKEIAKDTGKIKDLSSDLSALYTAGLIRKQPLAVQGPRGLALSPNGEGVLAVASYFSGEVLLLDSTSLALTKRLSVGTQPPETPERAGERLFFDAGQCFQGWLSCASCHPETRADGLNWDLLNDGMGNPKNTKSLVLAQRTPPVMSTGVRATMEVAVQTGFTFIQFRSQNDSQLDQVRAYLRSLQAEGSPYLKMTPGKKLACAVCHHQGPKGAMPATHMPTDGELTAEAQKGLKLFTDATVGCAKCHPGPLFTDLKMYDVGTGHELDGRKDFDTPTCFEMWRTAPYLHDGSAVTLMDMLTTLNKDNKHGKTSQLTDDDRKALVAYLLSL